MAFEFIEGFDVATPFPTSGYPNNEGDGNIRSALWDLDVPDVVFDGAFDSPDSFSEYIQLWVNSVDSVAFDWLHEPDDISLRLNVDGGYPPGQGNFSRWSRIARVSAGPTNPLENWRVELSGDIIVAQVTLVPEPTTPALVASSLLMLGAIRQRGGSGAREG